MDLDRFVAEHQPAWARMAELTRKARRPARLDAGELDELVDRYQEVSAHLAVARSRLDDGALVARLTLLVGDANAAIYGSSTRPRRSLARFATHTFPAAVWWNRWFLLVAAALLFVPALVVGTWVARSDEAFRATGSEAARAAYLERDFEEYYSSEPAAQFASSVFVNNVQVAGLAFASGLLFGIPTALLLGWNGANLGVAAGMFHAVGEQGRFWGLIIPHGALELSAVVVAGGIGLRLGWTAIAPGPDRTRLGGVAEEGRRAVMVLLGLVPTFLVAGLVEGFVTGRGIPTGARVALGVVLAALFWAYVAGAGRRALAEGDTGLLRG